MTLIDKQEERPQADPDHKKRATQFSCDQYFWGYASGVVATKVPGYGEFVLAELTQTFEKGDVTFFFPLMTTLEQRLGRRPRFGAFDAAFEAWYVFDYFDQTGGLAAIALTQRQPIKRQFDDQGLPLCQAGLAMPRRATFLNRRGLIPQQMGRYGCPLIGADQACPINHPKRSTGGCLLKMGTSPGARRRYQLDRESETYKQVYKQRTATERINSQALALGIERPKLRNQRAIANQNSLIYVLINLRAAHRLRAQKT